MVLALGLATPAGFVFAQDNGSAEVNCETEPDNAACLTPEADDTAPAETETLSGKKAGKDKADRKKRNADAEQAAPADETAEQPAAAETTAEQPAGEDIAPEDMTPKQKKKAEREQARQKQREQPAQAAEEPQPEQTAEEPQPEQPAAEATAAEQPAAEEPASTGTQAEQPAPERKKRPPKQTENAGNEPDNGQAEVIPPEEATIVVPDNVTNKQRERIKAEERKRREEARDNRGELLGAAAIGAAIGALIPALGGKVIEDEGDRIIVERDGNYYVRKDESSLLRENGTIVTIRQLRGGRTLQIVERPNGVRIETVRDEGGYILRRSRFLPDGREIVLIDNRDRDDSRRVDYGHRLPPLRMDIPRDRYIVPARRASRELIYETIAAPPVERVENAYTLREVRESERLRAKVRRVDLDTITFETGSAIVRESQIPLLEDMAKAILALIDRNPSTVILVEGHTDAVGSEIYNLALSDRRAETVARILVEWYDVPPENLVVQGYGEQFLKIDTQGAEPLNRRAAIRNITPLLDANAQ